MIGDIKDIEGDRHMGVSNLFTIYGQDKGKKITALLIFIILELGVLGKRQVNRLQKLKSL